MELLRDISKALNNYANKLQANREVQKDRRNKTLSVSLEQESLAAVGWTCLSDPGRWLKHQCMGWRPDENGEYHGVWRRIQKAEFRKLFQGTDLDIEEVDEAIGTIAFVSPCAADVAH